jgi:hypothetical protein
VRHVTGLWTGCKQGELVGNTVFMHLTALCRSISFPAHGVVIRTRIKVGWFRWDFCFVCSFVFEVLMTDPRASTHSR